LHKLPMEQHAASMKNIGLQLSLTLPKLFRCLM